MWNDPEDLHWDPFLSPNNAEHEELQHSLTNQ
jgi:hypothetical protein